VSVAVDMCCGGDHFRIDLHRPQWTGIDSLDTNACDPTQDANNGRRKRSREGGIMRSSASQSEARVSPIRYVEVVRAVTRFPHKALRAGAGSLH